MKTNLTTKQIKKIQNGKLAIFKDIDTAEAREYLLKVLDWLFPNDEYPLNFELVEENLCFFKYGDTDFTAKAVCNLPTIPLSQIMYTYNTEQFKPISMPCTEEQWSNDLKPVVESFGIKVYEGMSCFRADRFLTNNTDNEKVISTLGIGLKEEFNGKLLTTYSPTEFLEACGIVRVDKEQMIIFSFDIPKKETHTITTDQIKTARNNPETLEKIFPKVFEKPVVEVGKWWNIKYNDNLIANFFVESIDKKNCYINGYGFGYNKIFCKGISIEAIKEVREATLSDLQPLFEAEFNKRYKEGDLLESVEFGRKFNAKLNSIRFSLNQNMGCIDGFSAFHNGNFAKVIKSAELIKAEEGLEQAKKRVESLKNR